SVHLQHCAGGSGKITIARIHRITSGNLGVPLVILCILAMVILPLPPALLDILFTFNIVLAVAAK
ncbi:hypothetical protein, partial [Escherichia marmotae]|uniref:hypothetical protein n=1 Tax=Escherichia marmotae TaxID=1499973 RepID=UPI00215B7324